MKNYSICCKDHMNMAYAYLEEKTEGHHSGVEL
jgi:hypothetical protein